MRRVVILVVLLARGIAPAAAQAPTPLPADLREAMERRDKAASAKDAATWDRYTANEFTVVLEDGVLRTKAERLAHLKKQKPTPWTPPQQETVTVRGNVAVQRFRSGDTWAIVVWAKDPQGWRVIAAQDTPAKK